MKNNKRIFLLFRRRFFFIWTMVFVSTGLGFAQAPYVPLNHWAYNFIDRMEIKHILRGALTSTKPWSRLQFAEYLIKIEDEVKNGAKINPVENDQLKFLLFEFKEEIKNLARQTPAYFSQIRSIKENGYLKKIIPAVLYRNDKNLLSWQHNEFQIYLDPVFRYKMSVSNSNSTDRNDKNYHFTNGIQCWGYADKALGFFIDFRDNKQWGSTKYPLGNYTLPGLGFVRATTPDYIYHDETQAYLKLGVKRFQFVLGKFTNFWGNSRHGSLILSDYATSYDQFKIEFIQQYFKFTSIYAYLIDYKFSIEDSLQQRKYLVAHRLEVVPWQWLTLGLSETVVFGGRSFEPSYLNPIMFYRSAEHYLGSPDNVMMGIDFKLTALKNIKIYGELLIDDLSMGQLHTNWYGNKYGLLGGIFFAEPLGFDNFDVIMEYVKIRPYVYSHENSLQYTHYATSLGHWIGPNSDLLSLFLNYQPTRRLKFEANYKQLRHGENSGGQNFGGNIEQNWIYPDDYFPVFLGGSLIISHQFGLQFFYEVLRNLLVEVGFFRHYQKISPIDEKESKTNSTVLFGTIGINF